MALWLVTFRLGRKIARFAVVAETEREAIMIAWDACKPNEVNVVYRPEHGSAKVIPAKCLLVSKSN